MDAKHSPLPWRVFDEGCPTHHFPGIEAPEFSVVIWGDEHGESGVHGHTAEEARANAEFIVRCVNSHDELLAALKALCGCFDANGVGDEDVDAALFAGRDAIAKAEGSH